MILDESQIEALNKVYLESMPGFMEHLALIGKAIDLLDFIARRPLTDSSVEVSIQRLGVRVINSAGAVSKLNLAGYYQPAISQIRDLIELGYLLEYFASDWALVGEWGRAEEKDRRNKFGPVKVREALEKLDTTPTDRKRSYKLFSSHGTHVTPEGFVAISPNWDTKIGPFPDEARVRAIFFDLAWTSGNTAFNCSKCALLGEFGDIEKVALVQKHVEFESAANEWVKRFHKAQIGSGI